jgi:hypothetical protein
VVRRGQVGALAVCEQVKCAAQGFLDLAEGSGGGFEVALGFNGLGREPVLLGAQQVQGRGALTSGTSAAFAPNEAWLARRLLQAARLMGVRRRDRVKRDHDRASRSRCPRE